MSRVNLERIVDELKAAGLWGKRFVITGDGKRYDDELSAQERAALADVVANHDPDLPRDPTLERRDERRTALLALIGNATAETALDGFFRSIKARPDLPPEVAAYIAKHKI